MKLRYLVIWLLPLFLSGCSQAIVAQPNSTPTNTKPVAPIVEQVKTNTKTNDSVKKPVKAPEIPVEKAVKKIPAVEVKKDSPTIETTVPVQPEKKSVEVPKDTSVPLSNDNHYINTEGNEVHSPAYAPSKPSGASAKCGDGTYSFSQSRRGTCSHHGGVAEWY